MMAVVVYADDVDICWYLCMSMMRIWYGNAVGDDG